MAWKLVCVMSMLMLALSVMCEVCPSSYCTCISWPQKSVSCLSIGGSLDTILPAIPQDTKSLELNGATFYRLTEQDFDALSSNQVTVLRIEDSQLQEISNNAFMKFSNLRFLHLFNNQISMISNGAFAGLGNLKTLDLSKNRLDNMPDNDVFVPLRYLRDLDLSNNQIVDIPDGFLVAQGSLQSLNLEGNRISTLRGASFQGLQGLRSLHLSRCSIRNIDADFFTKLAMMDLFDLSYNGLSEVPGQGKLNALRQLRNFTLQGNRITILPDGAFQGLNLDTLDLSRNGLTSISPNAFMYLGSVRYLDLSFNGLVTLPENVFQPISSQVYSLKLDNNRGLISLPKDIFSGMNLLQYLNLSSCAFGLLGDEQFANVFSLRQVDLSNNMLSFLPPTFLARASQMSHLHLSNNPWFCDCNIIPLRNWLNQPQAISVLNCIDNSPTSFQRDCAHQKCSYPQKLLYRDIYSLQDHEIPSCVNSGAASTSVPVDIIVGVIVGVAVCVLVLCIIIFCCYHHHKKGEPLLCGDHERSEKRKKRKKKPSKPKKQNDDYYMEKKEKRKIDPEIGSLNESDKGFVVRNYFHSMDPHPDDVSVNPDDASGSQSMTRRESMESLSHSGYAYGSRAGSRNSSQYSLNSGYRIESAV